MITKKDITDIPALSCVERYFLAWLKGRFDVSCLYGYSFIELGKLFADFSAGARYENYEGIPRIQAVAEKYGLTKHTHAWYEANKALETLRRQDAETLCLIRVNGHFFKKFKYRAWRDDHYICVDTDLHWLNEYPLADGVFTQTEFAAIYDGEMLLYDANDLSAKVGNDCKRLIKTQNAFRIEKMNLKSFEDMVGVLRISRRRMAEFFKTDETISSLWREEVNFLDKLYFDIRRQLLKKTKTEKSLSHMLKDVVTIEKKIAETMK